MDPKSIKSRMCSVPGCGINRRNRPELGFFLLPKDPQRSEYWLKQICLKREPDKKVYVCEVHFEEAIVNRANLSKKRVHLDAVPTLNLPPPGTIFSMSTGKRNSNTSHSKSLLVKKRKIPVKTSPQSAKKSKVGTNAPSGSLDGDTVPSLQYRSQPTLSKVCVMASTDSEKSDQKLASVNQSEDSGDSNSKKRPNKINSPFTKEVNENITHAQSIIIDAEIPQDYEIVINNPQKVFKQTSSGSLYDNNIRTLRTTMLQKAISSKAFKQLCLKLYLKFPNEYKALHKLLDAPPKSEFRDVFSDSVITTESVALFSIYLAQKANTMTEKQRKCFVCIGESKIKPRMYYDIKRDHLLGIYDFNDVLKLEPATTVVVMILQGIYEDWKLPVAVTYIGKSSECIRPWVDNNIKNLLTIGFKVLAIVSRGDSNYFNRYIHNVNHRQINCLNDLSYLFKSIYYYFIRFGYSFDGQIVMAKHIVDYYKLDSKKPYPLMPKLTDEHFNPVNIEELKLQSVMEVFNMTTASAISAYIDFKLLDNGFMAKPTVEFISKMSKLYNILNTGKSDNKTKKGFTGGIDESQKNFLLEMLKFFHGLMLYDELDNKTMYLSHRKIVEKFKILIKSALSLWDNCKQDSEDLPIWRLNADAVELFFDQVKMKSKSITKPTAKEVYLIFKQTAVIHLVKNPVKKVTPIDIERALTEFQTITDSFKVLNDDYTNRELDDNYKISSNDYKTLELDRKDGIIFLAGFLLKKCNDIHNCELLKRYNIRTSCNVEALSMCESIMDDIRKGFCILPSSEFIEFLEAMEITFRTFWNKEILCAVNKKVLNSLLKVMDTVNVQMPCPCFPETYVKKLYSRFRIYHMLKYNNELLRTKVCRRLIVNKL